VSADHVPSPRVLALGGSLTTPSKTFFALRVAAKGAALAEADIRIVNLAELDLPLYCDGAGEVPDAAATLVDEVRAADALLLATPVYHGTMSGAMKNALDYFELLARDEPPWLEGKLAGLIAVSRGAAAINAINTMEYACRALHAWTMPFSVAVPGTAFASGRLEPMIQQRLLRLGSELASKARLVVAERRAALEPEPELQDVLADRRPRAQVR
jgi:FMN reductase